jgi:cell division protein FtsW
MLVAIAGVTAVLATSGLGRARTILPSTVATALTAVGAAAVVAGQATLVTLMVPVGAWTLGRRGGALVRPVVGPLASASLFLVGTGSLLAERLGPELRPAGASSSTLVAEAGAVALLLLPPRRRRSPGLDGRLLVGGGMVLYGLGLLAGRVTRTYRTSVVLPHLGEVVVAEPARVLIVVGTASWVAHHAAAWRRMSPARARLVTAGPVLTAVATAMAIAVASGDLGGALLTGVCVGAVIGAVTHRSWPVVGSVIGLVGAGAVAYRCSARAAGRAAAWLHPETLERGSQQLAGLFAVSTGGVIGTGWGRGPRTWTIPEVASDYAMAAVAHEVGLLGAVGVVAATLAVVVGCCRVAAEATTLRSAAAGLAAAVLIGAQALVNLLGVTLTAPLTGVPYPFISRGGMFTLTLALLVRAVLSLPRSLPPSRRDSPRLAGAPRIRVVA